MACEVSEWQTDEECIILIVLCVVSYTCHAFVYCALMLDMWCVRGVSGGRRALAAMRHPGYLRAMKEK